MLQWLFAGIGCGVLLTVPLTVLAARRAERRARRLEQRARAAERLAELGTLTGGLAHEIKNPLSTIMLNLQLLRESLNELKLDQPEAGRLLRRIDALHSEAERLRDILEDFLRFAGRMKLDRQPVDVNQLIDQVADFYTPQAEQSGIRLRAQLDPAAGTVQLDPTLIKQALLNLLLNATQAMVEARYGDAPHGGAADLFVRTQAVGEDVKLHVVDTGPGIPPDKLHRIFEPYYTTKKGGTGLGLAVARRIVEEHGGQLTVHSEPAKGSDFVITLPRIPLPTGEGGRVFEVADPPWWTR